MKKKIAVLLTPALLMLILVTVCVAPGVTLKKLKAEMEIEHWARRLMKQGGTGRDCSVTNNDDINHILDSRGHKRVPKGFDIFESSLTHRCWDTMELVEMTYYAYYNVVSGVYRCEKDGWVQELQLAIHLEPRSVPQHDDCMVGAFPKAWNIPVGEATMFSLP